MSLPYHGTMIHWCMGTSNIAGHIWTTNGELLACLLYLQGQAQWEEAYSARTADSGARRGAQPVLCRCLMQGVYLVADDIDAADAWVDALVLCQHLVSTNCSEALEEALAPIPTKRKNIV